jgi:predicted AAA+ superfamily ATPase
MAHLDRIRYIEPHITKSLSYSSIVGVVGQRQVGKTTAIAKKARAHYVSLDDQTQVSFAEQNPSKFLDLLEQPGKFPIAIDECQKAPALFPTLKLKVQNRPRPGQYLLSGSIRFTSRKVIQESLTGRITNLEMLPMSYAEAHRMPLGNILKYFSMSQKSLEETFESRFSSLKNSEIDGLLVKGGLPGICFLRETANRNRKFRSHIETLLQRDLRLIIETTVPYDNLRRLLTFFALNQGVPFNMSQVARDSQISANTLKKLIPAFENMFLIRRLTGVGDLVAPRFFLEDQGMASFLSGTMPLRDLIRFSFSQLFHQIHYRHMDTTLLCYYSNRGGAEIPLVFEVDHIKYGFIISDSERPNLSIIRSSESFLSQFANAKVMILSTYRHFKKFDERLTQVPILCVI